MRVVQHELNSTKILKILAICLGLITREIVKNTRDGIGGPSFGIGSRPINTSQELKVGKTLK
jgi:hypothetical protein